MALKRHIKESNEVPVTVHIAVPEDGSVLSGSLDCVFRFCSEKRLDELTDQVERGEMSVREQFLAMIPKVKGLPGDDDKPVPEDNFYDWFVENDFGPVIRAAIMADYMSWVGGARAKNLQRSRGR